MNASYGWHVRFPGLVLVIGLLAWPLLPARADDADEERAAAIRIRHEREAARTQRLLADLQLTNDQARHLAPLLDQAAALHAERYETDARLLPELIEACTAFAAEDKLGQGFSKEVERRTARVHRDEIEARDRFDLGIAELEQRAAKVLTPAQLARIQVAPGRPTAAAEEDRLSELRQELKEREARKRPSVGPVGNGLLRPAAYEAMWALARVQPSETARRAVEVYQNGTAEHPLTTFEEQQQEVARLRTEINNWNLINGLYLKQEQIQRIATLYDSGKAKAAASRVRQGSRPAGEEWAAVERAVEAVLNPGQRAVVADYKACLLPPKNLKDPVRVGQAQDTSAYVPWLTRARGLTGRELETAINDTLEREAKHAGELSKWERQKRVALLRKTAHEAGKMTDSEFELSKEELAARITPPDRIQELRKEMDQVVRARGEPGRITYFMLNADFIAQARERGQQLADGIVPQPVDLAAGPQAEHCEKGCALPGKKPAKK